MSFSPGARRAADHKAPRPAGDRACSAACATRPEMLQTLCMSKVFSYGRTPPAQYITIRGRLAGMLPLVPALLAATVVIVHAGLIPAGRWQADEYFMIGLYRELGQPLLWERLTHAGPKPVSDSLLYIYARAVLTLDRPHIIIALVVLWAVLVPAFAFGFCGPGPARRKRVVMAISVPALFLLGHPVGEMFYWPDGALVYLPAIAGISFAAFQIIQGLDAPPGRRFACACGLLFAAGSAESGAMTALAICGLMAIVELLAWRREGGTLRLLWLVLPAAASTAALVLVLVNRVAGPPEISQGGTYHALLPSLSAAISDFPRLIALADGASATGLAILAFAWAGLACYFRHGTIGKASVNQLVALAAGLFAGAYLILASAYFQFGEPCCQRHETFRGCLTVLTTLTLAALAARLATSRLWQQVPRATGPILLSLALLTGLAARIPAVIADYRQIPAVIAVRQANWYAGHQPGATMVFLIAPAPNVVNSDNLPVRGHFTKASDNPWFIAGLLRFFAKDEVEIRDP